MIKVHGRKIYGRQFVIAVFVAVCLILFIIPFWLIIVSSLSENSRLIANGISFWFQGFSFDGFTFLFEISDVFLHSIWVSVYTSAGTAVLSAAVCTLAAYVLSKKYLVGRKIFNVFFMLTMFFSGGAVPLFLVVRSVGIYNTSWALILPGVASAYNIMLIRNYFYGMPQSLEEAAQLDGASDLKVLVSVYLPLSMPIVATVFFTSFVNTWNAWLPSLMYVGAQNDKLWSVQYVLRQILTNMRSLVGSSATGNIPTTSAQNAGIVIVVLPLILISPFLQRFFVNGVTAGSVKG